MRFVFTYYCDIIMVEDINGFISVSISANIINRAECLFKKAGFNTRSGYLQDRLRRAIEQDEKNFR